MNRQEARKLFELADRLGTTPRRLLVAAASMAGHADSDAEAVLRGIRSGELPGNDRAEACTNTLLTPTDSLARDSIDAALFALWQGSGQTA